MEVIRGQSSPPHRQEKLILILDDGGLQGIALEAVDLKPGKCDPVIRIDAILSGDKEHIIAVLYNIENIGIVKAVFAAQLPEIKVWLLCSHCLDCK